MMDSLPDSTLPGDVCAALIRLMLRASETPEARWPELLTQISPALPRQVGQPNARIGLAHALALGEHLMRISPAGSRLGLAMAECMRDSDLGLAGQIARTAPTLGEALEKFIHFSPLLTRCYLIQPRLLPGSPASLRFQSPTLPAQHLFLSEAVLSICGRLISLLCARPDALSGATAQGGDSRRRQALAQQLGVSVITSPANSALLLQNDALSWPVISAEPGLHALLCAAGEQQLQSLERHNTASGHVQHWLASNLQGQTPSLEDAAEAMGLAAWTLRRRLQTENVTYRDLLDKLRFDLAREYLVDSRLSLGEIAFTLGFSSSGAFQRAFKRWSGETPGRYRELAPRLAAAG